VCIYLLVCVKQARVDVKREREGEEKNAQRICMCGTETFTRAARRQALNDKKKKTDARKNKEDCFIHIQKRRRKE
jgi:hypothetical protein